ncbi:SpaA isopeptide-forming pilin-related protein [Streptomyces sp. NBC_00237]|uniref:DUF7927 domain-containing protein n=1 Tax=Streptomyces sp. NBC_00237 TaxID=2975687 RepID=UPI0022511D4E|nr:SdrD B-like domain-containing protein [Streptomyces sp. NBC_00237]MCX5204543.1 SpaA isopeptide-forming pilin-related protein [Streptomyces sp. NBC_00237]
MAWGVSAALVAGAGLSAGAPAHASTGNAAEPGDGSVKVRVIRDYNADGTWNRVLERGMPKVEVKLTDAGGRSITGTTGDDGTVTLDPATSPLTGGKYRVEVLNPNAKVFHPAFAAKEGLTGAPDKLSSNEEFVDVSGAKNVEYTTGFWNPDEYCQKNAPLVTACVRSDVEGGIDAATKKTLVSFAYNTRGSDKNDRNAEVDKWTTKAETGALYGIGYSKSKRWVFSGAVAQRGANYGPGGPGAIYLYDRNTNALSQFTTVPNAGTTVHKQSIAQNQDAGFMPAVAKESLGDVEVSEDGKDLWVINANDKKLYRYDATQKTASAPKASYDIPNPNCPSADDWRPFAIGIRDGRMLIGGVCSGQSTDSKADMRAVIHDFNPDSGTFTGIVMDQKLDFPRGTGMTIAACKGKGWFPWADRYRFNQEGATCNGAWVSYPQPLLSDILFEDNGDLVLGFRDRFAMQGGIKVAQDEGAPRLITTASGGDINRACPGADGKFVMDGNGGCTNNASGRDNGGDTSVKEFYPGDQRLAYHQEAFYGGLALSRVEDTIATSAIDPTGDDYTNGTAWVNRTTGQSDMTRDGLLLHESFGKAAGMADIEVMCDEAPIQIGNRVWDDTNNNGIQDPDEAPVAGVTVNLYKEDGSLAGTTKTSARGEYYFDASNVTGGVSHRSKYTIKLDKAEDYAAGGPLEGAKPTRADAGTNDHIDSDGKVAAGGTFAEHAITTGDGGHNNHTYDFGFTKKTPLIIRKSVDKKAAVDGMVVTYTVVAENPGTDRNPAVITDDLSKVLDASSFVTGSPKATIDGQPVAVPVFDATAQKLTWTGPLLQGKKVTLTYQVRAPRRPAGDMILDNRIHLADSNCDTGSTDPVCATRVPIAYFQLTKIGRPTGLIRPGQKYPYEIIITNVGAVDLVGAWPAIVFDDMIDVFDDAAYNNDHKITQGTGTLAFEAGKGLRWTGDLKQGETAKFTYSITANRRNFGNQLVNNKLVSETKVDTEKKPEVIRAYDDEGGTIVPPICDPEDEDCENRARVPYVDASKSVDKPRVKPGEKVTYTWTVRNTGTADVPGDPNMDAVIDPIQHILKYADYNNDIKVVEGPGTVSYENGVLKWLGKLPVKQKAVIRFSVTVRKDALKDLPKGATAEMPNTLEHQENLYNCPASDPTFPPEEQCKAKVVIVPPDEVEPPVPTPVGKITVLKKDAKSGRVLSGAVFQTWRETNGTPGLQVTGARPDTRVNPACATDRQGVCTFGKLPLGAYYLRETAVPEGYLMPTKPVSGPYTLTKNNATQGITVTLTNKPGESGKKGK